ncbi:MAG: HsdR family type I site-specific deoxyribonuclease, partial [Bacteroidetes bacterium]|nr:HsdR family type I site-specific deoxyribonuclease [Bacteroidota bacterium]
MPVGEIERQTQDRIVKLFQDALGYRYLGNWEERGGQNVEEQILSDWLQRKQGYSDALIKKALFELSKYANDANRALYYVNKDLYALLRYGVKVKETIDSHKTTVHFIDWKNPENNDFAIAEEVTVEGENRKRPDIVLYINGIALGVVELKRSTIPLSEAIRQNIDNQDEKFIKSFYNTMQLVMVGNDSEGLRYGTIETPEKYYLKWKEADSELYGHLLDPEIEKQCNSQDKLLDKHVLQLCNKNRFLEIIHDFTVFDKGTKKVCRHNQYFGVNAAKRNIHRKEGGIIWHTQGSGKSLTMVWLAKWILENRSDARVLIITDRDELDKQIEKVFRGVDEEIHRTKSGDDLIKKLDDTSPRLLCSLIHKFGRKEEGNFGKYIEEIQDSLHSNFSAKGDFYVFVDECHRTQSGTLHEAMKSVLPSALFIGFTGTPLLKKDRQTSLEVFGTYIHTYKFDEAVEDGVILDLLYEARKIEQDISSPEKIDQWFEAKTKGLTDYAKVKLKKRWGTLRNVLSSRSRLNKIVGDVLLDMSRKERLQYGNGNAMLVAGSIYEACKYYQMFQEAGLKKCAIVTSYDPRISDIKGESVQDEADTDKQYKYDIYTKMLNGKSSEEFEDEVKKRFVNEPAQMKLLIVVDKLLTGFDAPSATYLYIDKSMQDHGLFQAICRVNRLDGEDKPYGYIVDYKDLFSAIEDAVDDYTKGAFEDFDKDDVQGLLTNRIDKIKEKLETAIESIRALCEPVKPPMDTEQYIEYFCGDTSSESDLKDSEEKRHKLYDLTSKLV